MYTTALLDDVSVMLKEVCRRMYVSVHVCGCVWLMTLPHPNVNSSSPRSSVDPIQPIQPQVTHELVKERFKGFPWLVESMKHEVGKRDTHWESVCPCSCVCACVVFLLHRRRSSRVLIRCLTGGAALNRHLY